MFGFLVGVASLGGLIYVLTHPEGHCHGGYGRPGVRFALRRLFTRLDTTPGQEKVIRQTVDELLEQLETHHGVLARSRKEIAAAFGSAALDEPRLGDVFAAHDALFAEARRDLTTALLKVHEVLDERQRRKLAAFIESGRLFPRPRAHCHAYRTAASEEGC